VLVFVGLGLLGFASSRLALFWLRSEHERRIWSARCGLCAATWLD
jgi:hypothetical protein